MILFMIRGQARRQTEKSYFNPTQQYTTEEPLMATRVSSARVMSAATVAAPACGDGCRDTRRTGNCCWIRCLARFSAMMPPAPRMVWIDIVLNLKDKDIYSIKN